MAFKRIQFFVLGAGYAFGATVNTTETTKEFMQLVMKKMLKKIAQGAKADVESDDEDGLRLVTANQLRYYKMEHAQGS
ncbi:uncharacterized protein PITG_09868 [Phytophthora infestans T30-4]|uniref:Uncharacterized protein n=1 Tax=Phytophthora infestans (strain T30-4) TaxID=403677 RepID=D0NER7_PHYIT|nr:uncharacterized protein PITG_09868 [Phytophthora infestans T30-4]EEY56349.1 hypothetical protein PITG_09868 [Phytophthora infestans T30-4]|eukprot:XP_002902423.1 hypothetical protein PITG_09868 [Phytophthora infestans T30-4]